MKRHALLFALLTGLLAGCSTTTPNYDTRFGEAVRNAKRQMTINPDAGKTTDMATGMDGMAAHESTILYQETFKSPPPAVNVINIGGSIGNGR